MRPVLWKFSDKIIYKLPYYYYWPPTPEHLSAVTMKVCIKMFLDSKLLQNVIMFPDSTIKHMPIFSGGSIFICKWGWEVYLIPWTSRDPWLHLWRPVHIISYADFHAHTKLLLFNLNIFTVVHLYQYAVCKFIYNSLHGTAPIFLRSMFEKNRNKRNSQNPRSFYHKKNYLNKVSNIVGLRLGINYHCLVTYQKLTNLFRNLWQNI